MTGENGQKYPVKKLHETSGENVKPGKKKRAGAVPNTADNRKSLKINGEGKQKKRGVGMKQTPESRRKKGSQTGRRKRRNSRASAIHVPRSPISGLREPRGGTRKSKRGQTAKNFWGWRMATHRERERGKNTVGLGGASRTSGGGEREANKTPPTNPHTQNKLDWVN